MARKSCIPGYDEALAHERALREEVFAFDFDLVCGVRVLHITPQLLARLFRVNTPFLGEGECNINHVVQLLWIVSPLYSENIEARDAFIEGALPKLLEIGQEECIEDINRFLDDTFLDAPENGGTDSVPYVCSVAWMLYKMRCEPYRIPKSEAEKMPIREIYQYIKCFKLEKGDAVYNSISDRARDEFLHSLNGTKTGEN